MLRCPQLANQETATPHGVLKFDENGECRQLTPEQEQEYKNVIGFEVVVEEPKAEKAIPKKPVAKKDEK